jgi:hypothetical protein
MTRKQWIATCAAKIVEFYGNGFRRRAEAAAADYLDRQSLDDDPIGAAVLIMEGFTMARE